jgi:hypothetical protein
MSSISEIFSVTVFVEILSRFTSKAISHKAHKRIFSDRAHWFIGFMLDMKLVQVVIRDS